MRSAERDRFLAGKDVGLVEGAARVINGQVLEAMALEIVFLREALRISEKQRELAHAKVSELAIHILRRE